MVDLPRTVIIRNEKYGYTGDIPNLKSQMKYSREFWGARGNKVHFKRDPADNKTLLVYISIKRFPSLVKKYNGDPRGWY